MLERVWPGWFRAQVKDQGRQNYKELDHPRGHVHCNEDSPIRH